MTVYNREVWIDAPKEKVWEVIADFGNIYRFNPTIAKSYLTSDQTRGLGTTRQCNFEGIDAHVKERIVGYKEGESMHVEIYESKGAPPFKTAFGTFSLEEKDGGTLVKGIFEYKLKFGPLGSIMDAMMVKPKFGKAWDGLMAGMKTYVETGQEIDATTSKSLDFSPVVSIA